MHPFSRLRKSVLFLGEKKRQKLLLPKRRPYYPKTLIAEDLDLSPGILHFIFAPTLDGSGILFGAANSIFAF